MMCFGFRSIASTPTTAASSICRKWRSLWTSFKPVCVRARVRIKEEGVTCSRKKNDFDTFFLLTTQSDKYSYKKNSLSLSLSPRNISLAPCMMTTMTITTLKPNQEKPKFTKNIQDALEALRGDDDGQIEFHEFRKLDQHYPMLLQPAFGLQDKLQEHTLGERDWIKILENIHHAEVEREKRMAAFGKPMRLTLGRRVASKLGLVRWWPRMDVDYINNMRPARNSFMGQKLTDEDQNDLNERELNADSLAEEKSKNARASFSTWSSSTWSSSSSSWSSSSSQGTRRRSSIFPSAVSLVTAVRRKTRRAHNPHKSTRHI